MSSDVVKTNSTVISTKLGAVEIEFTPESVLNGLLPPVAMVHGPDRHSHTDTVHSRVDMRLPRMELPPPIRL